MKTSVRNDKKTQASFAIPKPQPKQKTFFQTTNKHVGYGGAR